MPSRKEPEPLSPDVLARLGDSMIAQVRRDFAHVSRENGVSLHEAYVRDDWGSPEECARARLLDTDTHWNQVDLQDQPFYGSALSFLDPIGFRYYYAALMVGILVADKPEHDSSPTSYYAHSVHSHATPPAPSDWRSEELPTSFSLFNASQLRCVARFLVYELESSAGEPFDADMACEPLARLWLRYLPSGERKQLQERWSRLL